MDDKTYSILLAKARKVFSEDEELDPDECHREGIDFAALSSLVNQLSVRALKAAGRRTDPRLVNAINDRISSSRSFHGIEDAKQAGKDASLTHTSSDSAELCTCPALAHRFRVNGYKMAKMVVEAKYGRGILSTQQILTESPHILEEDPTLWEEVLQAMSRDRFCSHPSEQLKECVGKEYEEYLLERLREQKMCFETEADLRSKGKPKTPDVLFSIPMAIRSLPQTPAARAPSGAPNSTTATIPIKTTVTAGSGSSSSSTAPDATTSAGGSSSHSSSGGGDKSTRGTKSDTRGILDEGLLDNPHGNSTSPGDGEYVVVNWIDSKALFADEQTFSEHLEQLRGYINRYGRGLVIYWHGYAQNLKNSGAFRSTDGMVELADEFPSEWLSPVSNGDSEKEGESDYSDGSLNRDYF